MGSLKRNKPPNIDDDGKEVDSNTYRKIDGRAKKRILYLLERSCMQCGEHRTKALRIMPKCYINYIQCLNCIKFRSRLQLKGIRLPTCASNSVIYRSMKLLNRSRKCTYCDEHRLHCVRFEKGRSNLKCYNCSEVEKARKYDDWVNTNYP